MSDPFLAEIRIFGFNFAPAYWAACNGQSMAISQNVTLFSIIGTLYGGDGRTSFNLPNLQGSATCSQGQGVGLTLRQVGQTFGSANVTLQTSQLPSHNHSFTAISGTTGAQMTSNPTPGSYISHTLLQRNFAAGTVTPNSVVAGTIGAAGSGQPHENRQPYLAMNFCICLNGIFPARP